MINIIITYYDVIISDNDKHLICDCVCCGPLAPQAGDNHAWIKWSLLCKLTTGIKWRQWNVHIDQHDLTGLLISIGMLPMKIYLKPYLVLQHLNKYRVFRPGICGLYRAKHLFLNFICFCVHHVKRPGTRNC